MTVKNHFSSEFVPRDNSLEQSRNINNPELKALRKVCKANPLIGLRLTARSCSMGEITIRQAAHIMGVTDRQYAVMYQNYRTGDLGRVPYRFIRSAGFENAVLYTCLTNEQIQLMEFLEEMAAWFPARHFNLSHPLIQDLSVLGALNLVKMSWHTSEMLQFDLNLPKPVEDNI